MEFDIIGAIGSIGFPIIMCLLMFKRIDKQDEQHKEEMTKITESLNNNTLALTRLTERLSMKEGE